MAKHRTHSLEFKCQVAQEFLARETLHGLAKRCDLSRNLIRIWIQRFEAGALDEDAVAADLIEQCEARIAALERLVGKQALELEFVKRALKSAPRQKSAPTSVIVGPPAYPSLKDAGFWESPVRPATMPRLRRPTTPQSPKRPRPSARSLSATAGGGFARLCDKRA
jgi:transposase